MKLLPLLQALLLTALLPAFALAEEPITPEQLDFFEAQVRPNLIKYYYECHSADAGESRGGLYLDTRDGVRAGGGSGSDLGG